METTAIDEVGGIITAFEAQVGDRRRPLAIIARFRVRVGAGSRIEKAFAEASVQTAREAGVLAYQLHREPGSSDAFVVYERWRNLDDLEAHLRTPYIVGLRAEIDAVMEGQPSFSVVLPI
jgi:quinol monooxygenase YgiN